MNGTTVGGLAWVAVLLATVSARPAQAAEDLLVFAASSTTEAMQEAAEAFAAKTGGRVHFSFGASSDLSRQIRAGAPVDLFLAADTRTMDDVQTAGLILEKSRRNLLTNRLVVVSGPEGGVKVTRAQDLERIQRLSLADPAGVPAGRYAKAWLETQGSWSKIEPHVLPALNVRAALAAVEVGAAEAAVVYQTDALVSSRVHIVFRVPLEQTPAIRYPLARLVHGSSALAGLFYAFLQTPQAKTIFTRRGFIVLDEAG